MNHEFLSNSLLDVMRWLACIALGLIAYAGLLLAHYTEDSPWYMPLVGYFFVAVSAGTAALAVFFHKKLRQGD